MKTAEILGGLAHTVPADLKKALLAHPKSLAVWNDITPIARNEWLCWLEGAVLNETRDRRLHRTWKELSEGIRRPCCWMGCVHRTDKAMSPSQKWVLSRQKAKK